MPMRLDSKEDCSRTYNNFYSYKKHMYHRHRDLLNDSAPSEVAPSSPLTSDTSANIGTFNDDEKNEDEENEWNEDSYDSTLILSLRKRRRHAALFALKTRHVHKVVQSSIPGVMCDFSSLLESTVQKLKSKVTMAIENAELKKEVEKLFDSPDVVVEGWIMCTN